MNSSRIKVVADQFFVIQFDIFYYMSIKFIFNGIGHFIIKMTEQKISNI